MDYMMDSCVDAVSAGTLTASQARKLSQRKDKVKDVNYSLTIKRLLGVIRSSAIQGHTSIDFTAPSFVLDGCLGDPILLARQLKKRLEQLGYKVERRQDQLKISWE